VGWRDNRRVENCGRWSLVLVQCVMFCGVGWGSFGARDRGYRGVLMGMWGGFWEGVARKRRNIHRLLFFELGGVVWGVGVLCLVVCCGGGIPTRLVVGAGSVWRDGANEMRNKENTPKRRKEKKNGGQNERKGEGGRTKKHKKHEQRSERTRTSEGSGRSGLESPGRKKTG